MSLVEPVEPGARLRAQATTLFKDVHAALPAGVTLARASAGRYFDASGVLQNAASGAARFGYLAERLDKGSALLIEPASQNWVKDSTFTAAAAGSDPAAFNTTTTSIGSVTIGTLPGNSAIITPTTSDGSTFGWRVVAKGTDSEGAYVDIRLKCFNNATPTTNPTLSTKFQRLLFTLASGTGVVAANGETWCLSGKVELRAGSFSANGNLRSTMRPLNAGAGTSDFADLGIGAIHDIGDKYYAAHSVKLTQATSTMTAGFSVATPAKETTDVTLRFRLIQLEKQPAPTSPILTDNSAYATRSADTLSIDTGLGAGTYHVRFIGMWKNYDVVGTTGTGTLVLTTPSNAIADGSFLFSRIVISTRSFAPDPRRLRWEPLPQTDPLLVIVSPTTRTLPAAATISPITGLPYGANGSYEPTLDVLVVGQAQLKGPLKIVGGRRVRVIGLDIFPEETPPDFISTRSTLAGVGQADEFYVEGCKIDGAGYIQRDGINAQGTNSSTGLVYNPIVTIQNCRADNLHGEPDYTTVKPDGTRGNHTDVFQPFDLFLGGLRIDRETGRSSYQGLFLPDLRAYRFLSRIDLAHKVWAADAAQNLLHPYPLWLGTPADTAVNDNEWPLTTLHEVYVTPRGADTVVTNGAWPSTTYSGGASYIALAGAGGRSLGFPPKMNVRGCVRQGPPPGGDFVTEQNCGLGYKTPGYGWTP